MDFYTLMLPTWTCHTCGRIYVAGLNNICMVCRANRAHEREKEEENIKYPFRELPQLPLNTRTYYECSIDLDEYK